MDLIEQSHERCAALGLTRIERPDYAPLMRSDLTVARERNQRLFTHAAPVMEMLFEQIANTESMMVLTDIQGTILHSVGDNDFLERAGKVALSPGVNWAEHSKGTNAIGTALFEERPTLVHADEHFMHANHFLTCSAAPIFDPRGNMLGVLDVSGDQRSYHQHTMGLVRMSARMIENHWLNDDYSNRLRLHFHSRAEFIGTLLEGIVVVGPEGQDPRRQPQRARPARHERRRAAQPQHHDALRHHQRGGVSTTSARRCRCRCSCTLPSGLQVQCDALRFQLGDARRSPCRAARRWRATTRIGSTMPSMIETPAAAEDQRRERRSRQEAAGLAYLQTGDAQMEVVVQKVRRILNRDIPLLVLGETGTGKELLARAVHQESNRARQPFVAVNCASIPETLIEAELFGYEEGAFTGAKRKGANGRIVQANGGTLFLDEIGDMPLTLQARLLRVLQERSVTPLGSHKSIAVDIAVIGATHRNLRQMIEEGRFREDLYYRLNGLVLRLPALRERTDLPVVARRILAAECPQDTPRIGEAVMAMFRGYNWPGNIRQLANVLRTAAVMAAGEPQITEAHLSDDFVEDAREARRTAPPAVVAPIVPAAALAPAESVMPAVPPEPVAASTACTLEEAEIEMIRRVLAEVKGNISEASKRLNISRNTIYRKLRWNQKT